MDPRRKRVVAAATLPATMGGMSMPLMHHFQHSPYAHAVAIGVPCLMVVPLVYAMVELTRLKRDGNPY